MAEWVAEWVAQWVVQWAFSGIVHMQLHSRLRDYQRQGARCTVVVHSGKMLNSCEQ